jgi:propionyl-CoA carboxylase alpha chain
MITRLLVANRGEIARRVFRTCRELGVETVAVHSDPDADAPHVREADLAVHLPGAAPADTYLRTDLIVAAAVRSGADAVHPGYGFLSENADFARAVLAAGLTWVGPPPDAMAAMGSKITAKKLMADAGVPVLPSTDTRFPLLVKAAAGGGGRGMRVVRTTADLPEALRTTADLPEALASAAREAASAFGDPTVFCEPLIEGGRHIEVQILADTHGTVWALGERECSIQRRHQKIIEETPSPGVGPRLRDALCAAAVRATTAIGYAGAGTVEFLLTASGEFFFLEVNTRLQVEHPVTEAVHRLDLVAWQLAVAEGAALPPEPPAPRGHAIEARLYAEDPANDWRPQSGVLHRFTVPPGVRLDSGVEDGSVIGTHYDPMLAKVIAWAPTRATAVRALAGALAAARIHGPATNRDLLVRLLRHPAFQSGDTDTGFLDRHDLAALAAPLADAATGQLCALAAAIAGAAARRSTAPVLAGIPTGWRNNPSAPQRTAFTTGAGDRLDVAYTLTATAVITPDRTLPTVSVTPAQVVLTVDGVRTGFAVSTVGDVSYVDSIHGSVTLTELPRFPEPTAAVAPGSLLAPMPGTVVRLDVGVGDRVTAGQPLLVLEAMKMEHPVTAPGDGVVTEVRVAGGSQVEADAVLAVVSPASTGTGQED